MTKIYITSDWHLAEGAWKKRPEIYGDAFKSLQTLVKLVGDNDLVLAAGDLFDTKYPSSSTVIQAQQLLNELPASAGVYYIQGQHEIAETPWMDVTGATHIDFIKPENTVKGIGWYSDNWVPKNSKKAKPVQIQVYAADWSLSLKENLDILDETVTAAIAEFGDDFYRILMLHQTCNAAMAGTGNVRDANLEYFNFRSCELNDGMIPHGFDLVVVGDTHHHAKFHLVDRKGHTNLCLSPGSFAMQTVAETNTGRCFVLEFIDDLKNPTITSQALYIRPYEETTINNPVEFDQVIRQYIKEPVKEHFETPIIRITVYERDADRIKQLQKACAGKAFPFFIFSSEEEEGSTVTEELSAASLAELITEAIDESTATTKAKQLLTDLLSNISADEVLDNYYKVMVKKNAKETVSN